MRWKIFNGGTNAANVREQEARADESPCPAVRTDPPCRRGCPLGVEPADQPDARWSTELETQGRVADDLLLSYREQFNVGRRSLLDVLDAQNTRYNVQAQAETARLAKLYAQYRVLAATNRLIEALGVQMPTEAWSDERAPVSGQSDPACGSAGKQHAASRRWVRPRPAPACRRRQRLRPKPASGRPGRAGEPVDRSEGTGV